jgi:hypothetical protein
MATNAQHAQMARTQLTTERFVRTVRSVSLAKVANAPCVVTVEHHRQIGSFVSCAHLDMQAYMVFVFSVLMAMPM